MKRMFFFLTLVLLGSHATAETGILMRCGASEGRSYFFKDKLTGNADAGWQNDGIKKGKIVLVNIEGDWDILFDDHVGAYGYRQDGAQVLPLGNQGGKMTFLAFHPYYTDLYTFDLLERVVIWSSHKIGTPIKKAAIYEAHCE